jgi:VCBS repeat-containing protein
MADITKGIVVSLGNTPQAGDDLFLAARTGLTEDALGIRILDVMANDLGGAAKTLYSLDDGTSVGGIRPADLLIQDTARAEALSTDRSAHGAKIWITADGKVGYDASASAAFVEELQHLAAGEYLTDSFTYAIRLGNGTLSWATATVQIAGANDAPVVTSALVSDTIAETNATLTDSGAITFTDADHGAVNTATLTSSAVTATGVTLTAGQIAAFESAFTIDAAGHWTFNLASPDYLAAGDTVKTVYTVMVTDEHGAASSSTVTVTVTGTNDGPVAVADVAAGTENQDLTIDVLANDTDLDDGHVFTLLSASAPSGQGSASVVANQLVFTPGSDFDHLAQGATASVTLSYSMRDEHGAASSSTVTVTVTGTNDGPVITSNGGGAIASVSLPENTTAVTTVAATDIDDGATRTYSIVGGADAAKFNINGATGALSFVSAPDFEAPTDTGTNNVYDVTVRASDGTMFDDQAIAVAVTNVNEASAPTNSVPAAQTVNEDIVKVFSAANGNQISISDVDNTSHTVTLTAAHGTLTLNGIAGLSFTTGDGTADATMTFSGTDVAINTALNGMSFKGDANYNGNASLQIVTSDGALSDTDTVAITVVAVNDPPIAKNDVAYVSNNTHVTILADAFLSNDTDRDGLSLTMLSVGGATSGIQNLTLNANGTITFDSQNVGAESFTYTLSDNAGGTSTATVTVNIVSTNGTSSVNVATLSGDNYQAAYLDGGSNTDNLTGGSAPDIFIGGAAVDTLIGGNGNDILQGGAGNDSLDGGAGTDLLDFSEIDTGFSFALGAGGSGTATVNGTDSYSNVEGVIGGDGIDTLTGNASDNVIRGGLGNDIIDGGAGVGDLLDLSDGTAGINFTLVNGSGTTNVNLSAIGLGSDTYSNFEGVIGTNFADTLIGSIGNDVLKGGDGNDTINGGAGNDILVGGSGADIMAGGIGSDTFAFAKTDATAVDTVSDFNGVAAPGSGGDVLDISDLLIGYNAATPSAFINLRESGGDSIVSVDRDGSGSSYSFQDIAILQGATGLDLNTLIVNGNIDTSP